MHPFASAFVGDRGTREAKKKKWPWRSGEIRFVGCVLAIATWILCMYLHGNIFFVWLDSDLGTVRLYFANLSLTSVTRVSARPLFFLVCYRVFVQSYIIAFISEECPCDLFFIVHTTKPKSVACRRAGKLKSDSLFVFFTSSIQVKVDSDLDKSMDTPMFWTETT